MNAAHIHLILNHVPVLGMVFGILILLIGMIFRSMDIKKVSLGLIVVAALATIPVYFSGEEAEDIVEPMPGVTHEVIHDHEEAGELAMYGSIVLGILALITLILVFKDSAIQKWAVILTLVLGVIMSGILGYAANLGGKIRHTEIRSSVPTTNPSQPDNPGAYDAEASENEQDHEHDSE